MAQGPDGFHRILLALMLVALLLTSIGGAVGLMHESTDHLNRLWLTGITTIIACVALLLASRIFNKRRLRGSSVACMGVITVEYLLVLGVWWGDGFVYYYFPGSTQLWSLIMAVGFAGVPAVGIVRMLHYPTRRVAGVVGLILNAIALIMMSVYIASDSDAVWYAGFWLSIYSLVIVANMVGLITPAQLSWRWFGVLATGAGYGILTWSIFTMWESPGDWKYPYAIVWLTSVGVFCGHLNVSLRAPLSPGWRWLRWVTVGMVGALGALASYFVTLPRGWEAGHSSSQDTLFYRLITSAAIAAMCGSMAMFLLKRMTRKSGPRMIAPPQVSLVVIDCPLCRKRQPQPLGRGACVECGLLFSIKIGEPKCESCGYLLYRLRSGRCPECGAPTGGIIPLPNHANSMYTSGSVDP